MTNNWFARTGKAWICLVATLILTQGCARQAQWNGVYQTDLAGGARTCVAPTASPSDGQTVVVPMQVSNEGGWCGISATRNGAPFDSYVMVNRPAHGRVFAHRVGSNTRIDYFPDAGFTGTDSFAVRMIPGNAVIQGALTVSK